MPSYGAITDKSKAKVSDWMSSRITRVLHLRDVVFKSRADAKQRILNATPPLFPGVVGPAISACSAHVGAVTEDVDEGAGAAEGSGATASLAVAEAEAPGALAAAVGGVDERWMAQAPCRLLSTSTPHALAHAGRTHPIESKSSTLAHTR